MIQRNVAGLVDRNKELVEMNNLLYKMRSVMIMLIL